MGLAAMAALVVFGCGKPESNAGPGQTAGKKIKLAGIIFQEDQFFHLVKIGMHDGAKKAGVELLDGNSNNKPEKEIELVNTYATQGVDAILISPLSKTGSVEALKKANEKGIKIICHNTPIDADFIVSDIESDAVDLGTQTGQAAAKYIAEKMGGKANIAILAFKSQVPEQSDARCKGFKDEMAKLPGVKIVAEQDAWLPEMAVKKAEDIMTAHPEVDLIWAANEGGTVGSVMAVKNAGKAGKVVVFGTDSSEQLVSFLQDPDNILQAITSQKPVEVGQMAVDFAVKAIKGEKVEKKVVMKGICLSRTDPAGIADFKKKLDEWQKMD